MKPYRCPSGRGEDAEVYPTQIYFMLCPNGELPSTINDNLCGIAAAYFFCRNSGVKMPEEAAFLKNRLSTFLFQNNIVRWNSPRGFFRPKVTKTPPMQSRYCFVSCAIHSSSSLILTTVRTTLWPQDGMGRLYTRWDPHRPMTPESEGRIPQGRHVTPWHERMQLAPPEEARNLQPQPQP